MMLNERTTLLGNILNLENEALESVLVANSSYIICGGIVDLILGFLALCSPIAATMASYSLVTALFYIAAICRFISGCFAEPGYKMPSFVGGVWQFIIACILKWYPLTVLSIVTIFIAVLFMIEGIFRTSIACSNKDMPGYWKVFAYYEFMCSI